MSALHSYVACNRVRRSLQFDLDEAPAATAALESSYEDARTLLGRACRTRARGVDAFANMPQLFLESTAKLASLSTDDLLHLFEDAESICSRDTAFIK